MRAPLTPEQLLVLGRRCGAVVSLSPIAEQRAIAADSLSLISEVTHLRDALRGVLALIGDVAISRRSLVLVADDLAPLAAGLPSTQPSAPLIVVTPKDPPPAQEAPTLSELPAASRRYVHIFPGQGQRGLTPGGVIVEAPTGVFWRTQGNGMMCSHPEAEGFFFPLPLPELPHGGCSGDGWTAEEIEELSRLLLDLPVALDPSRWAEATEAWLPVTVKESRLPFPELGAFAGSKGWLIYPNCD